MNKKEFQELVGTMYVNSVHFSGDMKFYYGGAYHTREQAVQDLAKFDPELGRRFRSIVDSHEEFAAHIRHKLG